MHWDGWALTWSEGREGALGKEVLVVAAHLDGLDVVSLNACLGMGNGLGRQALEDSHLIILSLLFPVWISIVPDFLSVAAVGPV